MVISMTGLAKDQSSASAARWRRLGRLLALALVGNHARGGFTGNWVGTAGTFLTGFRL